MLFVLSTADVKNTIAFTIKPRTYLRAQTLISSNLTFKVHSTVMYAAHPRRNSYLVAAFNSAYATVLTVALPLDSTLKNFVAFTTAES